MKTAWGDCLALSKDYHHRHGLAGDAADIAAYKDVMDYLEETKKSFTAAELETWAEKSGTFFADGYSREEADTAAADLVLSARLLNNSPQAAAGNAIEDPETPGKVSRMESYQGNAPDTPLNPQKTKSGANRTGLDGLKEYVKKGIAV
jgi:hypothetical protein